MGVRNTAVGIGTKYLLLVLVGILVAFYATSLAISSPEESWIENNVGYYEDLYMSIRVEPYKDMQLLGTPLEHEFTIKNIRQQGGYACIAYEFEEPIASGDIWIEKSAVRNVSQEAYCPLENKYNYTTNPKFAGCYYNLTEGNATEHYSVMWEHNFDSGNVEERKIYWSVYIPYTYWDNVKSQMSYLERNERHFYYSPAIYIDAQEEFDWKISYLPDPSDTSEKWDLIVVGSTEADCSCILTDTCLFVTVFDPEWGMPQFSTRWNASYDNTINVVPLPNFTFPLNHTGNGTLGGYVDTSATGFNLGSGDCNGMRVVNGTNDTLSYMVVNDSDGIYGCGSVTTDLRIRYERMILGGNFNNTTSIYTDNVSVMTDGSDRDNIFDENTILAILPSSITGSHGNGPFTEVDASQYHSVFTDAQNLEPFRSTYGVIGRSLYFDGDEYLTNTSNLDYLGGTANLSVSFWYQTDSTGPEDVLLLTAPGAAPNHLFRLNPGGTVTGFIRSAPICSVTSTRGYPAYEWHYVVFNFHGGTSCTLYVDGLLVGTDAGVGTPPAMAGPMYLGFEVGFSHHYAGYLDEVIWRDQLLTLEQIRGNYQIGTGYLDNNTRFSYIEGSEQNIQANVIDLVITPSSPTTYLNNTNATCTSNTSITLLRNGTDVTVAENATNIVLPAGTWNYTCIAAAGGLYGSNITTQMYIVNQFNASVRAFPTTQTIQYGFNASQYCTDNVALTCSLFRNDTAIGNGTFSLLPIGVHTYIANISDTANYSDSSNTQIVTIVKVPANVTLTTSPATPINYETLSNATCVSDNPEGGGGLLRNGTDVTALDNNTFVYLPAATWNYTCYTNETQNYTGDATTVMYIVNQLDIGVSVFPTTQSMTYEDANLEQYCTDSATFYNCSIFRNDTSITNGTSLRLGADSYEYIANITDTANYTNWRDSENLTINQKDANVSVYPINQTLTYPNSFSQSCIDNSTLLNCVIYRDGAVIAGGTTYTPDAGIYAYLANISDSSNYTNWENASNATLLQAPLLISIWLNDNLNADTFIPAIPINATAIAPNQNSLNVSIFRNESFLGFTFNISGILPFGNYTYKANITGNTNYTGNTTGVSYLAIVSNGTQLFIDYPENNTNYTAYPFQNKVWDFNFTIENVYPTECWYNVNGSNITLPGCNNTNITFNEHGNYILTLYANETTSGVENFTTHLIHMDFINLWTITNVEGTGLTTGGVFYNNGSYNFSQNTTNGYFEVNTSQLPHGNMSVIFTFPGYIATEYNYSVDNTTQINSTLLLVNSGLLVRVFGENSGAPINWYKLRMINSTSNGTGSFETQLSVGRGTSPGNPIPGFLDGSLATFENNPSLNYTYQFGYTVANFSITYDIDNVGGAVNNITIMAWDNVHNVWVHMWNLTESGNTALVTAYFSVNNSVDSGFYGDLFGTGSTSFCLGQYCPRFELVTEPDATADIKIHEIELVYPYVYDEDGFAEINYTNFQLVTGISRFIFSSPVVSGSVNNYAQRQYFINPTSVEQTQLDAYLNQLCYIQDFQVLQQISDVSSALIGIGDATLTLYRQFGADTNVVDQQRTDATGIATLCVEAGYPYTISIVHPEYDPIIIYDKIWSNVGIEYIYMSRIAAADSYVNPYRVYVNVSPEIWEWHNPGPINYTCTNLAPTSNAIESYLLIRFFDDTTGYPRQINLSTYPPSWINNTALPFNLTNLNDTGSLIANFSSSSITGSIFTVQLNDTGTYEITCGMRYVSDGSWCWIPATGFTLCNRQYNDSIVRHVTIYPHGIADVGATLQGNISELGLYIVMLLLNMIVAGFFVTKFGARSGFIFLISWALTLTILGGWGFNPQTGLLATAGLLWMALMLYPFRRSR